MSSQTAVYLLDEIQNCRVPPSEYNSLIIWHYYRVELLCNYMNLVGV